MSKLYRPREGRWIAGVCAGLALRIGISSTAMRLIWIFSALAGAPIIVYLVMWVAMPSQDKVEPTAL